MEIDTLRRALRAPVSQIAKNVGADGSINVNKLLEQTKPNFGSDARNDSYVDMLQAGIIDTAKVVRIALQDAESIAGPLIIKEAMVAEIPEIKAAPATPADMVERNDCSITNLSLILKNCRSSHVGSSLNEDSRFGGGKGEECCAERRQA